MSSPSPVADALKEGLRRLAKAVVVITCVDGDKRFAMAATAVSELSLDPPSLLICVNKSASMNAPLARRVDFAVNILHRSQEAIATLCSGQTKGDERFRIGNWTTGPTGVPILADAQASFQCRYADGLSFGTHDIIIGEVFACDVSGSVAPLVYADRRYVALSANV